ncbi:MAG: shikimate kinase [Spirochaetes bacterium]|nr:shikimate kinase [Spirochaetota bacterium]
MNISFIGYRCSGKSTISALLEKTINWERFEIDKEIENYFGLTIPEVIKKYGWEKFRAAEARLIKKYSSFDYKILDLGGGAVLNYNNIKNIKKNGVVIFLNCDANIIKQRLEKSYYRPPLTRLSLEEEIKSVLNERLPLYNRYSDYKINTDILSIEQTLNLSIYYIREYKLLSSSSGYFYRDFSYTII